MREPSRNEGKSANRDCSQYLAALSCCFVRAEGAEFEWHCDMELVGDVIPYGWTVGLDLPTAETVNEAIEFLKSESA